MTTNPVSEGRKSVLVLLDQMERAVDGSQGQFERCRKAGNDLATAIRNLPEDDPTKAALYPAYEAFMQQDAGNFGPPYPGVVMSDLVPSEDIERIVGARRDRTFHQARAVSDEQTVYILHSQECLDSGVDVRQCRYSLALDNGIREDEWVEDEAVVVTVTGAFEQTRLIPILGASAGPLNEASL